MVESGTPPWKDALFSWVHVSDIHIGHGDAAYGWDQRLVLEALRADAAKQVEDARVPRPRAIFVTGDVAFSGASRSALEYQGARDWLVALASAVGLTEEDVFVVPGNHDVQRGVDAADPSVGELVQKLRAREVGMDAVLGDPPRLALLEKRQANFLAFAESFGAARSKETQAAQRMLYWRHRREAGGGLRVSVAGLNTALLAADDQDLGRLRLGNAQLAHALLDAGDAGSTIRIVLSHHPFRGGWLADEANVSTWFENHAHLHLSGHVHEADAERVVRGSGSSFMRITAGAAHGDAHGAAPASHGYNFGALLRAPDRRVQLGVWPRRWSVKSSGFRRDTDNTPDDKDYSLDELPRVKLDAAVAAEPAAPKRGLVQLLVELSSTDTFAGRTALLEGLPIAAGIKRSEGSRRADLELIFNQLRARKLKDGRPCLAIVIENALPYAEGTDLEDELAAWRSELV
jgi:3',5'-cyclic AMP phosphodiesterase CpdA